MAYGDKLAQRLIGRRFFYGWVIVFITFVTSMLTAGVGGYGLSFFILPMSAELGISRAEFSSVAFFRLVLLPIIPFLGVLVDKKHGPRLLITIGGIASGLTLIATSKIGTLWEFYFVFGILFGLAMLAMGGMLVGPAVISKWFVQRRGRAMAIGTMGISTGGLVIAPLAGWAISQLGWRSAWVILGLVMIFAIVPLSALFMRRSPEDMGLHADGEARKPTNSSSSQSSSVELARYEYPWTVRQAIWTKAFWILMVVQSLGGAALSSTLFHQVAYVQDKGFGIGAASSMAIVLALFAAISKLGWGVLTERIDIRWVMALCGIPAGFSLLLLVITQGIPLLYAFAICYGLTMGGFPTIMNVVWPTYFGREHAGAIRGVVGPVGNIAGALGPFFAGVTWDITGTYNFSFIMFAIFWALAGLVMLAAHPPTPPTAVVSEHTTVDR